MLFGAKEIGLEELTGAAGADGIGKAVVLVGKETNPVGKNASVLFSD